MSSLQTVNQNNSTSYLDSREVAAMVEKQHFHLLRDIASYIEAMQNPLNPILDSATSSTERKIAPSDFFIESTYVDSTGRILPCYLISKMGCEFVANKLTGEKGIRFTAAYVTKFNQMESSVGQIDDPEKKKIEASLLRAQAMLTNAKTRQAALVFKAMKDKTLSPIAVELFGITTLETMTDQTVPYRPQLQETHYTATEIGKEAGVSANKVGKVANANDLKTAEYGIWVMDKSPHSVKQVESFRYNELGRAKLLELLNPLPQEVNCV